MFKSRSTSSSDSNNLDPELLPYLEIDELLTQVKQSQGQYYKMINLEVWALIETLDQFFPGAWSRFMANRQLSLKQFLQRQRSKKEMTQEPSSEDVDSESQS